MTQPVSVPIRTGVARVAVVPSPSRPYTFQPQAQRVPSVLTATVWSPPADTEAQLVPVPIRTGRDLLVVVPSPSSPTWLYPQAHSAPSFLTPTVKPSPAVTEAQPVPSTRTGRNLCVRSRIEEFGSAGAARDRRAVGTLAACRDRGRAAERGGRPDTARCPACCTRNDHPPPYGQMSHVCPDGNELCVA